MAERHRSNDGSRDTDKFIEDMPETPDQQGRAGGRVARDVGTQDSLKRATKQGVSGVTRVTKADEDDDAEDN
ncbi:hypothetical protein [Jannaschia rubra]|uniref:Uncharacterized protein n=1 Tax=Jannaschia rubra TaxID=282197 RepID=A0A0M6XV94_9RHOB|nr:hypothetical protein [Jannaschia rubra]CTQ34055.1 hypothetical protein JAN5088_02847 [Jannaschia rubra]SFG24176.1 hypothetical protein SAMN04488517_103291 [Jannaschia rubra]